MIIPAISSRFIHKAQKHWILNVHKYNSSFHLHNSLAQCLIIRNHPLKFSNYTNPTISIQNQWIHICKARCLERAISWSWIGFRGCVLRGAFRPLTYSQIHPNNIDLPGTTCSQLSSNVRMHTRVRTLCRWLWISSNCE